MRAANRRRALGSYFKKYSRGGYIYSKTAPYALGGGVPMYYDGGPTGGQEDLLTPAFPGSGLHTYGGLQNNGMFPRTQAPQFNYNNWGAPIGPQAYTAPYSPPNGYTPAEYPSVTPGFNPGGKEASLNADPRLAGEYNWNYSGMPKTNIGPPTRQPGGNGINGNTVAEYLAPAYNLGMGMFSKVDRYTPKKINEVPYVDKNFDPTAFKNAYAATNRSIRDLYGATGGAGANAAMMANSGDIASRRWAAQNENANENQTGRMNVNATNAGIQGQNAQLDLSAYGLNRENRAAKQQMLATGIGQLGQIGAHNQDEENASKVFADYLGSNWATILRNQKS